MSKPEPEELTDIGTDEDGDWVEGVVKEQSGGGPVVGGPMKPGDRWAEAEMPEGPAKASLRWAHTKRTFASGATRDTEDGKYDLEGFLSPLVLERYAEYMHKNRHMADGATRDSDNWQKGIPLDQYMKSGWRHFMDWWTIHRDVHDFYDQLEEALCALMFNVMGYLHEHLKNKGR